MDPDLKKLRRMDEHIQSNRFRIKDYDQRKVLENVFDEAVFMALHRLASRGVITAMGGAISTGKEANVFHALGRNDEELAVKIYRISTSDFRKMDQYLLGDPRFADVKRDKKSIVLAWTRKEQRNLQRAYDAGVKVPRPLEVERNILVMEFIGEGELAAPRLKEAKALLDNPERIFETIIGYMNSLYTKASLVHCDMSEFNILWHNDEPVVIDMAQAVTLDHSMAEEFLRRDVHNILNFFRKLGVESTEEEVLQQVKEGMGGAG
jgi:RIO kinase 1